MEVEQSNFWDVKNQLFESKFPVPSEKKDVDVERLWEAIDFDGFVENPIKTIDDLFARRTDVVSPVPVVEWESKVLSTLNYKFLERRSKAERVPKIPCLNDASVTAVKNGQLVTFRCMIQDMIGPEITVSQASVTDPITGESKQRSTLLRDMFDIDDLEESRQNLIEKEVIVGVSPPGENPWVSSGGSLDGSVAGNGVVDEKKSKLGDENEIENGIKSLKFADYKQMTPSLFPNLIDGSKPMACLLKMYRTDDMPKQNELVEVCGLIYFLDEEPKKTDDDAYGEGVHPDLQKFPVIHVFSAVKLANGCPRLLLMEGKLLPTFDVSKMMISKCVNTLRALISLSLGGDRYAAVYVMLGLVSRILMRDGSGPIGKLVVNLRGIDEKSDTPELLKYLLLTLMPRVLPLDLTIENLNEWNLTPKKNMDTNQLEPGLLQMCDGTVVFINETKLNEGKLFDQGTRNVQALKELLEDQEVRYNYTYQFPSLKTDCPVITVSTSPSILPADITILTKPDTQVPDLKRIKFQELLNEKVQALQDYLSLARSLSLHSHPLLAEESLMDDLEAFFKARNEPNAFKAKMSPLDFSAFLTSCRLWCLLNGEVSITREGFTFMKELEQIKDSRLPAENKK